MVGSARRSGSRHARPQRPGAETGHPGRGWVRGSASRRGGASSSLQLELARDEQAPAIARAAVKGACQDAGVDRSTCSTVVLLLSEVVTNAVLHSHGSPDSRITLALTVSPDRVGASVTDEGHGFTPIPRDPTAREGGGYGLYLLEKSATRWGVSRRGGTCVWFEVNRTRDAESAR
jgi:anti-sigma regulatory factor (Ser/Thr protein kinase)